MSSTYKYTYDIHCHRHKSGFNKWIDYWMYSSTNSWPHVHITLAAKIYSKPLSIVTRLPLLTKLYWKTGGFRHTLSPSREHIPQFSISRLVPGHCSSRNPNIRSPPHLDPSLMLQTRNIELIITQTTEPSRISPWSKEKRKNHQAEHMQLFVF